MLARSKFPLAMFALAATVLLAYASALQLGFYGDDWIFYDLAGRLSLADYLVKYIDPNAQTAWFRPVQGVLWRIGYTMFGTNPLGYHAVNVVIHLANVLLLFALVQRETRNARVGFVAALVFATLPTAALAVFWAGVIDSLETFFYLTAIWFWLAYLREERVRDYVLAFIAFLLALFSKELGVTLPVTLFLLDRFHVARPASLAQLARRYALFVLALIPFGMIEWIVTRRSVFVNREGYSAGAQIAQNLADYLSMLAFPWVFAPPFSYLWLVIVIVLLAYLVIARKRFVLVPLVAGAVMAILPVAPFPFVAPRFLYLSLVASAILCALAFEWLAQRLPRRLTLALLVLVAAWGCVNIADAAAQYAEDGRVARVPFRNVRQAHPTLPDDTYFYFINPPVPGPNLSGMFLWQYGTRAFAGATDSGRPANLRDHADAYVVYWNAQGDQKEQRVEKEITVRATRALPVPSGDGMQLEAYELARARVKRGEPIVVLLYWRANEPRELVARVELVAPDNRVVARIERAQTLSPRELGTQAIVLPQSLAPGTYRLIIGLTDTSVMTIEPIVVEGD
ncbi:MAG: glycosyltransferase family 39 protein [Chloroflexi bacterium]|nr:glycosyltransferase family 39 protein [Chloroflexota bacterium]